ncbi:MAG: hypothetical protein OIF48_12245 [Silicimonas sp.]|nr:hypothetical protein [Silicimonas sp.]
MRVDPQTARGGAAVAALNRLDGWEANLILNMRLWCEGGHGKTQVWDEYLRGYPEMQAQREVEAFSSLMAVISDHAARPLVRHSVGCNCVGSDECVFLNLVRTAADGFLNDAALIATLLAGPARAEMIAMLAGQVGEAARVLYRNTEARPARGASNVVQLH